MHHDAAITALQGGEPATWHLCWQAAVGRQLFSHPPLYARVRNRLIEAHRRRGRVLIDFVLLPTEMHVVARVPAGETPGDLARAIGNVVARWVRETQPVRSPVFAGPYRAYRISSDLDLRNEVRMMGWRPVIQGLCKGAAHHAHGALRVALGMTPAYGFDARPLLQLFGGTVIDARSALRAWIAKRPTANDWLVWDLARGLTLARGSVGPNQATARAVRGPGAAALVAAGGEDGIDGALRLLSDWVAARLGGTGAQDLHHDTRKSGARGRALVGQLAIEHDLCSAASVARYFGRAKSTLSEQITASRRRVTDQRILCTPVHRIVAEAKALEAARRLRHDD